jgi:hypothetical protein
MSRASCFTIAGLAAAAIPCELFVGFGLWFSPGWANGWPGLRTQLVVAAGLSAHAAVVLLTIFVGIWALYAAGSELSTDRLRSATVAWCVITGVGTALAAGCLFVRLYE